MRRHTDATKRSTTAALHQDDRCGIALMLVLISVGVVTVASLGFLAAREGSPQVGANAVLGARARAAAETGIDLAEAIMQCSNIDWRTSTTNGVLVQDFDYGGELVTITVTDLDGNPPTADTEYVAVTANGKSSKMVQGVTADVYTPIVRNAVSVDLSEFAAFGVDEISLNDGSIVRWKQSPRYHYGEPIRLGTNGIKGGSVSLSENSHVAEGKVYVAGTAAETIISDTSSNGVNLQRIDVTNDQALPVFLTPTIDVTGLPNATIWDVNISFGLWSLSQSKVFGSITVTDTAVLKCSVSGLIAHVLGNLKLDNGGTITVGRSMTIVVDGDVTLNHGSSINVENGASLDLFIGGDLSVNNASSLGLAAGDLGRCASAMEGLPTYSDPRRVRILKLRGTASKTWCIDNGSATRSLLYAPNAYVKLNHASFVTGSIMAQNIDIRGGSVLHYDHGLDQRLGYTNPQSHLFSAARTVDSRVSTYAATTGIGTGIYYFQDDGTTFTLLTTPVSDSVLTGPDLSAVSPRERVVYRRLKMLRNQSGITPSAASFQ